MILSDSAILEEINDGNILIEPFNINQLGSNSYDLTLSKHLAIYEAKELDCKKDNQIHRFEIPKEGHTLYPNTIYLASTIERTTSKIHRPCIEGKSSIGRLGIQVHLTAGYGDVGFSGHWTLEISVVQPVRVYEGMQIAQIEFSGVKGVVNNPYDKKEGSKYSGQNELPQRSKMFKNFK